MNILIIEDELLIANDLKNTLTVAGHQVMDIARTLEQAVISVKKQVPDLVLLDIILEGSADGVVIAREILEMYRIPIIVLTSNTEDSTYQRVKNTFLPAAYITKPIRHIDLPRLVELAWQNFRPDNNSALQDLVFLPVEKRYEKILKSEVVCISTLKGTHSVHIFEVYGKQPRLVNLSLGHIEQLFYRSRILPAFKIRAGQPELY
ncbi:MAG: response regulator [Leadbetterella sp.]|nr:response regulator [Leadbetterella sp.]